MPKKESLENIDKQIEQLKNHRKKLLQFEKEKRRKARAHRLIERGAIVESLIDGAESMSNDDIKGLLLKALKAAAEIQKCIVVEDPPFSDDDGD